jgi:hypothetical protein
MPPRLGHFLERQRSGAGGLLGRYRRGLQRLCTIPWLECALRQMGGCRFAADSVDGLFIWDCLDQIYDPNQVLNEAARIFETKMVFQWFGRPTACSTRCVRRSYGRHLYRPPHNS